jgi:hypothetical protein
MCSIDPVNDMLQNAIAIAGIIRNNRPDESRERARSAVIDRRRVARMRAR